MRRRKGHGCGAISTITRLLQWGRLHAEAESRLTNVIKLSGAGPLQWGRLHAEAERSRGSLLYLQDDDGFNGAASMRRRKEARAKTKRKT